jgi:predicted component of type VI protein secretion system
MDKCPYCSAETRPGDNFCLNCGNRLPAGAPSAQPVVSDSTVAADDNWVQPVARADNGHDAPTVRADGLETVPAPAPAPSAIDNPARMTLRTDSGEAKQEFVLEKIEFAIGRGPNSDILLSKDKLTSRRHATISYEQGTYFLIDERSANGTFVNGQQLEEKTPYKLQNGDVVSIGEYELVFHASSTNGIESMDTVMVAPGGLLEKYETEADPQQTSSSGDPFGTRPWDGDLNGLNKQEENGSVAAASAVVLEVETASASAPAAIVNTPLPAAPVAPAATASSAPASSRATSTTTEGGVTFNRLTSLPQPQLPDVAPLMAALATLDGQVSSLQEQLNETQEAMRNHEADIAQTTNQLRAGVRRVSERMDTTIADVARSREQLAWAELLQLMEDVMNNPRDIEYVTKLARKARELNKVFQIHQNVLNTLAECTSLLRSLIGE